MSFSEGKVRHMKALSNKQGVIAAAAMDQRGSLKKSIASAKGVSRGPGDERDDERVQDRGVEGADAARERHPAGS